MSRAIRLRYLPSDSSLLLNKEERLNLSNKLSLPSGESVKVLLYGATVISWIVDGQEKLFLSEKAKLGKHLGVLLLTKLDC